MGKEFFENNKDKVSMLLADKENEIWRIIDNHSYTNSYIKKLISAYISVSKLIGTELPYKDVKSFFCDCYEDGINEYNEFLKYDQNSADECFIEDDFEFILNYTQGEICREISCVLNDSDTDPHHSAVYTTNMIKCFIFIFEQMGIQLLYKDVCGFFIAHGFSQQQYFDFENRRKKESVYYRSIQY